MYRINKVLATLAMVSALAISAQAQNVTNDPSISFDESQRTGVSSQLFAVAASFPGDVTIASNAAIAGTLGVVGNQTNSGTFHAAGATQLTGRKPLLSKDGTTQYAFETGSSTGTAVITYTTAFSANPLVFITPLAGVGVAAADTTNFHAIMTSPRTNFTTRLLGTSGFNWLAIGAK